MVIIDSHEAEVCFRISQNAFASEIANSGAYVTFKSSVVNSTIYFTDISICWQENTIGM